MLGVRVQLSQPGLETPVRSAGHNLSKLFKGKKKHTQRCLLVPIPPMV